MMHLPDFPVLPPEAFAALAQKQHVSPSQIIPLPDVGITNRMYRFGDHLMLRVPRNHPHIISLAYKEAKVVPAARAAGVHTPAISLFDDSCTLLPVPYTLYERVPEKHWGCYLEPEATPDVWRALGRDLARLHTAITPALLPPEEVGQCDDVRAAPAVLAETGVFTLMEARWLERWLNQLAPYALAENRTGFCMAIPEPPT